MNTVLNIEYECECEYVNMNVSTKILQYYKRSMPPGE